MPRFALLLLLFGSFLLLPACGDSANDDDSAAGDDDDATGDDDDATGDDDDATGDDDDATADDDDDTGDDDDATGDDDDATGDDDDATGDDDDATGDDDDPPETMTTPWATMTTPWATMTTPGRRRRQFSGRRHLDAGSHSDCRFGVDPGDQQQLRNNCHGSGQGGWNHGGSTTNFTRARRGLCRCSLNGPGCCRGLRQQLPDARSTTRGSGERAADARNAGALRSRRDLVRDWIDGGARSSALATEAL